MNAHTNSDYKTISKTPQPRSFLKFSGNVLDNLLASQPVAALADDAAEVAAEEADEAAEEAVDDAALTADSMDSLATATPLTTPDATPVLAAEAADEVVPSVSLTETPAAEVESRLLPEGGEVGAEDEDEGIEANGEVSEVSASRLKEIRRLGCSSGTSYSETDAAK